MTESTYPQSCDVYHVSHKPRFHFNFIDVWWPVDDCRRNASTHSKSNNYVVNNSEFDIPTNVEQLLAKGPKFRIPVKLDDKVVKETEKQLDALTYRLRYADIRSHNDISLNDSSSKLKVPYSKNTVCLPQKMNAYKENCLFAFKREVNGVIEKEIKTQRTKNEYKKFQSDLKDTRSFLTSKELVAVRSDKTNRIVITNEENHIKKTSEMLNNPENYKVRDNSKCKQIETQANRLIKNIGRDKFDKDSTQRLITMGSSPAKFTTLIKDHKCLTADGYPLRPLASTVNTPTDKIDWLTSRILNQLLKFIPSHLMNTDNVINKLGALDKDQISNEQLFISLDVVNLYPSIPIDEAIKVIIDFATEHWKDIDAFGLSTDDLRHCLTFIAHNYEIEFHGKTYLQIKGCPMGSHFSPPFAIIFMHAVEQEALKVLKNV